MALSSKGDGGSRGRPYGMMLLLAFGAAVLGVMVLHMLRERRSFSILIQHKDQDIMNLHLLLKKERESSIEYRKNIDDLKAQAYSLQTQKMELSNKVATLQSITTSLKDEQRVLESIIEDNQSMIRTFQQKRTEFTEGKSQKEAGIKEMKRHANKSLNSDYKKVDGDNVVTNEASQSQNVSEAIAVKDNHAGHLGIMVTATADRIIVLGGFISTPDA